MRENRLIRFTWKKSFKMAVAVDNYEAGMTLLWRLHHSQVSGHTCWVGNTNKASDGNSVQQQQSFYSPLSVTTRVSWYQKKHSPTQHHDHHPIFISFFHLPWSIASSLFKLPAWQSFCTTSLHVLFGLPLGLEPSTSYSVHFFTQSVSSSRNTCPYHRNLFCCSVKIISYVYYYYFILFQMLTSTNVNDCNVTMCIDHSISMQTAFCLWKPIEKQWNKNVLSPFVICDADDAFNNPATVVSVTTSNNMGKNMWLLTAFVTFP